MRSTGEIQDVEFTEVPSAPVKAPTAPRVRANRSTSPEARAKARLRQAKRSQESERRVGLQHLAFFRGYLEGLELVDLGDLYLEFGRDARKATATKNWLLTSFVAAARKRQDFATARLLSIKPTLLGTLETHAAAGTSVPQMSLDDFAAEHDPDGFYTENELLDLFTAHYAGQGEDGEATLRRQKRNVRLRGKQMHALEELSRLVVEDPKPEHHVLGWFDTSVALRLSDVGITTIGKLVKTINSIGYRWYRNVPRLGEVGAGRIAAWLAHYGDIEGLRITPTSLIHPSEHSPLNALTRTPTTGIAPLELFLIPPEIDGSNGANRNLVKNNSGAVNDLQAIEFWLADYENEHTRLKYRTEAERLLLWAIFAKQKPLSSLDVNDAREYINAFLVDPQPIEKWVMSRAVPRHEPEWRPFRGPLSIKSRQDALAAMKKFFGDLVNAQYLDHNCFSKIKVFIGTERDATGNERRIAAKPRIKTEHSLTLEAWSFAMQVLRALPDSATAARIRFALTFAYSTGLRRSELCSAFTDEIREVYAGADLGTIHVLRVVGKGAKERFIPLPPMVLDTLGDYLETRGFPRDPYHCPAGTPLIPALLDNQVISRVRRECAETGGNVDATLALLSRQAKPVHPDQLYKAIKRFFKAAHDTAMRDNSPHARAFSQVSTHWLRHTFVSHALSHGMSLESARNFAGHDSLDTTSIYATAEVGRQFREAEAFLRAANRKI